MSRDAVLIAVVLLPGLVLAAVGFFTKADHAQAIAAMVLGTPVIAVLVGAYQRLRFRHLDQASLLKREEIPRDVLIARAAIPVVALILVLRFLALVERGASAKSQVQFAAISIAVAALANLGWRLWTRAAGFNPDEVLYVLSRR